MNVVYGSLGLGVSSFRPALPQKTRIEEDVVLVLRLCVCVLA